MSTSCCGSIGKFIVDYFKFPLSPEETYQRIEEEAKLTRPANRKEYWDTISYTSAGIPPELFTGVQKLNLEDHHAKHALVIGRINDMAILYLLKGEWQVTVVDPSRNALNKLQQQCSQAHPSTLINNLSLVHQSVEDYKFPSQFEFILAFESFSYCNPLQFKTIWTRAHDALSKGGIITGNFRLRPATSAEENTERAVKGAWYITEPCLPALLEDQKYEKELCETHTPLMQSTPTYISFIARKV